MKRIFSFCCALIMTLTMFSVCVISNDAVALAETQVGTSIPEDAQFYGGHYYKYYDESMTWEQAEDVCENLGGYLATVTLASEQEFVHNLILNGTKNDYFLGGRNSEEDDISWITGEPAIYTNWNDGEPNDYFNKDEIYIEMIRETGKWNDTRNTDLEANGFICEWDSAELSAKQNNFQWYFAKYLMDYWEKASDVDMPCAAIIRNGGKIDLVWTTILESLNSLTKNEIGIDERGYYKAILLDLMTNQVTSVDYAEKLKERGTDLCQKMISHAISKGVDIETKEMNTANLKTLYDEMQDVFMALDVECGMKTFELLVKSGVSVKEGIETVALYVTAKNEGQHLTAAVEMMAQHSDYQPLTQCLNELASLMNSSIDEMETRVANREIAVKTVQLVKDFMLDVIKDAFPLISEIEMIVDITKYGCELVYPTDSQLEQKFRIYALYHIQEVCRASFKSACNAFQSNDSLSHAYSVVSCYDMFVRVYEHEIAECIALAELIYSNGLLNGIKNFFDGEHSDYQAAKDWVNSYNVNLDIIKDYKIKAYLSWGIEKGAIHPVRLLSVTNGKISGYYFAFVENGGTFEVPSYQKYQSGKYGLNKVTQKIGVFEGWYYDEACTMPCMATSLTVSESVSLYARFSLKDEDPVVLFKDLNQSYWYVKNDSIRYVYNYGLFNGTSKMTFGPEENMTRAMFVTVLGRLDGQQVNNKVTTVFADVKKNQYYTGYVKWAYENQIVAGLTKTTFGPDENITREQICAIMVRYCDYADIKLKQVNPAITFKDAAKISKYARSAVKACQMGGLVNGEKTTGGYNFRPQGNASRAEVATIIMNFAKTYQDDSTDDPGENPGENPDEPQPPGDMEIGVGPGTLPDEDENW